MRSVKIKLLTAFLTVISVLFLSEIFFVVIHFIVVNKYEEITDNMVSEYRLIETTDNLVNSFYDLIQYAGDQQRMNNFLYNLSILRSLLAKLDNNINDLESRTVYLGVKNTIDSVINQTSQGVSAISAGNFSEVTIFYKEANQRKNFARENTTNLLLNELEYIEKLRAGISYTQILSEIVGLCLFVLAMLGCLWYSVHFSRKFVSPLLRLNKLAKRISSGNLEAGIDKEFLGGDDEIAGLAGYFNVMLVSLKENSKKLKEKNDQLAKIQKIMDGGKPETGELSEADKELKKQ
jgi:methyl-accepting chemotaxis protein